MKRPSMHLIVGLGSAALAAAVALPRQGDPHFPERDNKVYKIKFKKYLACYTWASVTSKGSLART